MRMENFLPIVAWVRDYEPSWFKKDLLAGLTLGVILIPQGIAYATIAGLPPQYGLYTALIPQLIYALLGTSRQLAIGPAAMDSLIVGAGLSTLAQVGTEHFIAMAMLLAFSVGFFQFLFGLLKMGFLVNFLSRPVISGFTSGSAIIIAMNQFGNLFGLKLDRSNQVQNLIFQLYASIDQFHWQSVLIGGLGITLILILRKIDKRIPGSLIVVLIAIGFSAGLALNEKGVEVLGKIPAGLPEFSIPSMDLKTFQELSGLALTLALIGFLEAISIGKSIQTRHSNYRVKPNKELVALGFGNMIGSLFMAYPSTAGFSRTAINDQAGAQTPLSSVFAALIIALTLIFLTPFFFFLPKSILAAIIVVAALGLLDFKMPRQLLNYNWRDLLILNSTLLFTLFVGIMEGILFGIILSLVMLIYKSTKPHMAVLGQVPDTHYYRNVKRFDHLVVHEEILIVRFDAQLYFANTDFFREQLALFVREKGDKLRYLIIDGESLNALDSSAIYTLEEVHDFYTDKGLTLVFTGLKGPVRDTLVKSKLMKKIRYDHCFMSIQEAVNCYEDNCFEIPKHYTYQEYTKQSNR